MQHKIDNKLWAFDDERVTALHEGRLPLLDFGKVSRPEDPWQCAIRGDPDGSKTLEVVAYDAAGLARLAEDRMQTLRELYARTGGLDGAKVYELGDLFCLVYPELREGLEEVRQQIVREKCQGCVLKTKARPLLLLLFSLPAKPDRPYELLADSLTPLALDRLKAGGPLPLERVTVPASKGLRKRMLPLRKQPLDPATAKVVLPEGDSPEQILGQIRKATTIPQPDQAKLANPGGPRPACLDCARKHVAQAVILLGESLLGYPHHRWLVVGHLAEASEEVLAGHAGLAAELREERLKIAMDAKYVPDLMRFYPLFDEADTEDELKAAREAAV